MHVLRTVLRTGSPITGTRECSRSFRNITKFSQERIYVLNFFFVLCTPIAEAPRLYSTMYSAKYTIPLPLGPIRYRVISVVSYSPFFFSSMPQTPPLSVLPSTPGVRPIFGRSMRPYAMGVIRPMYVAMVRPYAMCVIRPYAVGVFRPSIYSRSTSMPCISGESMHYGCNLSMYLCGRYFRCIARIYFVHC